MHVISAQVLGQWNELTDEQVVTQVIGGQTALFEVLMRRYNEECTGLRADRSRR